MVMVDNMNFKKNELSFEDAKSERPNEIIVTLRPEPMQFTGLKDKNGKDIYEGDIIKKKYLLYLLDGTKEEVIYIGEVIFSQGAFMISKCAHYNWHIDTPSGSIKEWEVIGNIYENPELLKEKQ
jgi:uncharacterized phage protein (TIGR01671 family)